MKVFFIGEGSTDVGRPEWPPKPRQATGVVPVLSRKVIPNISEDSLAIAWREIPILNPNAKTKGLGRKVQLAGLLAKRNGCVATVCVYDQDGSPERLEQMEAGRTANPDGTVVCGLAIESIEAWTLGAPEAIAKVLSTKLSEIQKVYKLKDVESLVQTSEKPEKRPKDLLAKLACLGNEQDGTDLRVRIAEQTDVKQLEINCKMGFKPFAERLRSAFGPPKGS